MAVPVHFICIKVRLSNQLVYAVVRFSLTNKADCMVRNTTFLSVSDLRLSASP
jgi:hypothetical protein